MKQLPLIDTPKVKTPSQKYAHPYVLEESKGTLVLHAQPFDMTETVGSATLAIPWQKAVKRLGNAPPHHEQEGVMQAVIKQTAKKRVLVTYRIWNGSWSLWQVP
jgi:hypothetical protein